MCVAKDTFTIDLAVQVFTPSGPVKTSDAIGPRKDDRRFTYECTGDRLVMEPVPPVKILYAPITYTYRRR